MPGSLVTFRLFKHRLLILPHQSHFVFELLLELVSHPLNAFYNFGKVLTYLLQLEVFMLIQSLLALLQSQLVLNAQLNLSFYLLVHLINTFQYFLRFFVQRVNCRHLIWIFDQTHQRHFLQMGTHLDFLLPKRDLRRLQVLMVIKVRQKNFPWFLRITIRTFMRVEVIFTWILGDHDS